MTAFITEIERHKRIINKKYEYNCFGQTHKYKNVIMSIEEIVSSFSEINTISQLSGHN